MVEKSGCSEHTEEKLGPESGLPQVVGSWSLGKARQPTSYSSGNKREGEILTVEETAEYLKVRPSTVYSWVENSQIPHFKISRLIRFRRSDIEAWLISKRSGPESNKDMRIGSKLCGNLDIDRIVKKTIDSVSNVRYKKRHGKSDRIKGLRREVPNGSL